MMNEVADILQRGFLATAIMSQPYLLKFDYCRTEVGCNLTHAGLWASLLKELHTVALLKLRQPDTALRMVSSWSSSYIPYKYLVGKSATACRVLVDGVHNMIEGAVCRDR